MADLNPQDGAPLDERLKQYHQAIESEFNLAKDPTPNDLTQIKKNAAESFLAAVPSAVKRILYLMEHADRDTTQLNAARFVVSQALTNDTTDAADPLTQLLAELNAKPNNNTSTT